MDGQEFTYSWIDYNDQEWGNEQKLKVSLKGKEINLKKKILMKSTRASKANFNTIIVSTEVGYFCVWKITIQSCQM